MKKIIILLFLLNLVGCTQLHKETQTEYIEAKITQYGIYATLGHQYKIHDTRIPSGAFLKSTGGVKLIKETDQIPLVLHTRFGYDFKISGIPNDKAIILHCIVNHPPINKPNGEIVTSFEYNWKLKPINGVVEDGASYIMNHEYELVPGEWTRTFYYNGEKLLEKVFYVSEEYNKSL